MKNKLSRFAVPYEVWMAIFVVAPILIMVIYAFSSSEGGFTLDNFVQMGGYTQVFLRSFKLAIIATLICLVIGYPVSYLMSREGPAFQRTAMVLIMLNRPAGLWPAPKHEDRPDHDVDQPDLFSGDAPPSPKA